MVLIRNIKLVGNIIMADCYIDGRIYFRLEFHLETLKITLDEDAQKIRAISSYAGHARNKILSEWKETGELPPDTCAVWYWEEKTMGKIKRKIDSAIYKLKCKQGYVEYVIAEADRLLQTQKEPFMKDVYQNYLLSMIDYCVFEDGFRKKDYILENPTIKDFMHWLDVSSQEVDGRFKMDILMEQWEVFRPYNNKKQRGYDYYNEFKRLIGNDAELHMKVVNECKQHFMRLDENKRLFELVKYKL